jgi:hypothetical protein
MRDDMAEYLKTYNVKPPSAGINVHTSRGPAGQLAIANPSQRAKFFFQSTPVLTPGSGSLMAGNPQVKKAKKRG